MPSRTDPGDPGADPGATDAPAELTQASRSNDVPFEASLDELAGLVGRLESGSLGLTESIAAYERGVGLLHRLHTQLADAEERVRLLVRIDEQGRPILAPGGTPGAAGAAAGAGSQGDAAVGKTNKTTSRSGRGKRLPGMDDAADGG
jgi:exodeoxyribonuclease VII small subunit